MFVCIWLRLFICIACRLSYMSKCAWVHLQMCSCLLTAVFILPLACMHAKAYVCMQVSVCCPEGKLTQCYCGSQLSLGIAPWHPISSLAPWKLCYYPPLPTPPPASFLSFTLNCQSDCKQDKPPHRGSLQMTSRSSRELQKWFLHRESQPEAHVFWC